MLEISERARRRLAELARRPEHRGRDPRLFIAAKDCAGLHFDVAFDQPVAGDACLYDDGLLLLVHERTAQLVEGGVLDYDPETGRFTVTLPHGRDAFRGKFFRRPEWRVTLGLASEEGTG